MRTTRRTFLVGTAGAAAAIAVRPRRRRRAARVLPEATLPVRGDEGDLVSEGPPEPRRR